MEVVFISEQSKCFGYIGIKIIPLQAKLLRHVEFFLAKILLYLKSVCAYVPRFSQGYQNENQPQLDKRF